MRQTRGNWIGFAFGVVLFASSACTVNHDTVNNTGTATHASGLAVAEETAPTFCQVLLSCYPGSFTSQTDCVNTFVAGAKQNPNSSAPDACDEGTIAACKNQISATGCDGQPTAQAWLKDPKITGGSCSGC